MAFPMNEAQIINGIRKCFNDQDSADFIIKCENEVFYVHKIILSLRGAFFAGLISPHFKEGSQNEAIINDWDFNILRAVLQTVYGLDYDYPITMSRAEFDAHLYAAADFFQLPALKELSKVRFEHWVKSLVELNADEDDDGSWKAGTNNGSDNDEDNTSWSSEHQGNMNNDDAESSETGSAASGEGSEYADLSKPVVNNKNSRLRDYPVQLCLDLANYVYTSTPDHDRALRDVVLHVLNENYETLRFHGEAQNAKVLDSIPGLTQEIIACRRQPWNAETPLAKEKYRKLKCPECSQSWVMVNWEDNERHMACPGCGHAQVVHELKRTALW